MFSCHYWARLKRAFTNDPTGPARGPTKPCRLPSPDMNTGQSAIPPRGSCLNYWSGVDIVAYCHERLLPEPGANLADWTRKHLLPYAAMYDMGVPREHFATMYEDVGKASEMNLDPMRRLACASYGVQVDDRASKSQVLERIILELAKRHDVALTTAAAAPQPPKQEPYIADAFSVMQQGPGSQMSISPSNAGKPFPSSPRSSDHSDEPGAADLSPRVADVAEVPSLYHVPDILPDLLRSYSVPAGPGPTGTAQGQFARPPRPGTDTRSTLVHLAQRDAARIEDMIVKIVEMIELLFPNLAEMLSGSRHQAEMAAIEGLVDSVMDVACRTDEIKASSDEARRLAAQQQSLLDNIEEQSNHMKKDMERIISRMGCIGLGRPSGHGPHDEAQDSEQESYGDRMQQ
ncbi:hypothetical protein VSDG_01036 [Cytospora chrysosperma]|uniref:Uncharacterized protein n=1 Tax=Cytospora chrysosperma TaxID=252740 RepID=A0A423WLD5_CYTCH|nr:hypothetical protein VSDG_01036 [Valsa sordida]